jgi:Superfamily II DNA/RNA helicases, SNF2 family
MYSWIAYQNHLAITNEKYVLHPDASEIYALITGNTDCIGNLECQDINEAFPDIHFSKIGSPLNAELNISSDNSNISLALYVERNNHRIPVDVMDGQIIDQVVTDNEWFYINGNIEEIKDILAEANIRNTGIISMAQYMSVLRRIWNDDNPVIRNCVDSSVLNQNVTDIVLPAGLQANLYQYQKIGYGWLRYMLSENEGCILGDEMGLGKTLQIITLFQEYRNLRKVPVLVIAPVSLLQNWKRECEKFAPELRVLIHHGSQRTGRYKVFSEYDVVVTSYSVAVSDISVLNMIRWNIVVLDEAQNIKNPSSNRTLFTKQISRDRSIAVTGTPFENHVTDIWSVIDFIMPGILGDIKEFNKSITDDLTGAARIEPVLSPLMIRRLVKDVANDLPEKIIIPVPLAMSEREADIYEQYRQELNPDGDPEKLNLVMIQKLRQFCTHPGICEESLCNNPYDNSVKYQRFCEILEEIVASGEKVIVFTSYTKMFSIMENDVAVRFSIPVMKINGTTPVEDRQNIVDEFNCVNGTGLLILNPKAAGTGLNITAANHVIHYNLEWNPALEDQSSARAYRRGQKKNVFIYRLFYENTVEQIINERIDRKRDMADNAVIGTDGESTNREDILRAVLLTPADRKDR